MEGSVRHPHPPPQEESEHSDTQETPATQPEGSDTPAQDAPAKITGAQDPKRRKRSKKDALVLREEQEEDLIDWIKAHPLIYNKGLSDYKLKVKKAALWKEKADELDTEGECIFFFLVLPLYFPTTNSSRSSSSSESSFHYIYIITVRDSTV